jgi:hypothetical protein
MKTTYEMTVKTILERVTIVTVDGEDIEVPIVSDDYEPVFTTETNEGKTALRVEARVAFRKALRTYLIAYFQGKDIEKAKAVSISPTIKSIEGQTFNFSV